jgi:hypothetical protein
MESTFTQNTTSIKEHLNGWRVANYSLPQTEMVLSQTFVTSLLGELREWPDRFQPIAIQSQAEREFEEQKQAFLCIPKPDLEQYRGEFVASRNGQIVDHDPDLATLTNRFFSEYGDVAVYITRVDGPIQVVLRTPLFR